MTRRAGPELHRRLNSALVLALGQQLADGYYEQRLTIRQLADAHGLSTTTCWRRLHLYLDWTLPLYNGNPLPHRLPAQRGTEACPSGRPAVPGHDGPPELPRPRHLVPGQRCTKQRRDGKPCRRWCQRGAFVCRTHGGAAPQVIAAARRRVAELEAEARELRLDRSEQHQLLQHGAVGRVLLLRASHDQTSL